MRTLTDVQVGWIAGILEGEGCLTTNGSKGRNDQQYRLEIEMTDKDVIETLTSLVECGTILPRSRGRHRPSWRWYTGKRKDIIRIVSMVLPYMHERRAAKFEMVLKVLEERELVNR